MKEISLSNYHLIRSEKALKASKALLENNLIEDSVSRAINSLYHTLASMLIILDIEVKNLSDVRILMYANISRLGINEALHRLISQVFSRYEDANYSVIPQLITEDANFSLSVAVETMNEAIKWRGEIQNITSTNETEPKLKE